MLRGFLLITLFLLVIYAGVADAARISNIRGTKHNLSSSGSGTVKSVNENEVCVFCHTPHAATNAPPTPLWNRQLSGNIYTPYASSSLDATGLGEPDGSSKLCLSCHDGTMAIGAVNVLNGALTDQDPATEDIQMQGTSGDGTMPTGSGELTGFTRKLGTDLTNDHPISFTYDNALADADGELRRPGDVSHIDNRQAGVQPKPIVPLENNRLQCVSCHDPHITDDSGEDIKFLRLNRTQKSPPGGGGFDQANDIICLACHDKLGQAWSLSAHANPNVGDERYNSAAATLRDFPANIRVWEAACLNCHDTHTVQGSRRLLREGTDSTASPKSGGQSAIEETCYQCHSASGESILQSVANVPNIKDDFNIPGGTRMPISNTDQPSGYEVHDITTADFEESPTNLGKGGTGNRHVECTDCHNPHRVIKNRNFNDNPNVSDTAGTHNHAAPHSNIASGVLRGAFGVDPTYPTNYYSDDRFMTAPTNFNIKKGDGGAGASSNVNNTYLTREYQLCLKCHSNFAYNVPPAMGYAGYNVGTPSSTNSLTQYTNQAMEYRTPLGHKGEGTSSSDPGVASAYRTNNHRAWHPVVDDTGRTESVRGGISSSIFHAPWSGAIGAQTMYCTDCHGSTTTEGSVVPSGGEDGRPWGPHGSENFFLLKGTWNNETGTGSQSTGLCFKCHNYNDYANPNNGSPGVSGFRTSGGGGGMGGGGMCMMGGCCTTTNLHIFHAGRIGRLECTWCHVAVPHGWKNKMFLVNRKDLGPEAGFGSVGNVDPTFNSGSSAAYTKEPYYIQAKLGISSTYGFATSGNWTPNNCSGVMWMMSNCSNPP